MALRNGLFAEDLACEGDRRIETGLDLAHSKHINMHIIYTWLISDWTRF